MIDFHAHLDLYPNPQELVRRCVETGVHILSVTTTPSAFLVTRALAADAPRIRTALGLHPQVVGERFMEVDMFEELLPQVRYVGEVGIDGTPEFRRSWGRQLEVFDRILAACSNAGGRILSIHSRRATSSVLDALERHPKAGLPTLHWFSGTTRELARAVEMGCWFSVGPAMLLSDKGRKLVQLMPPDRVLTETDGPFVHHDGRSISPWEVHSAYPVLSDIWSCEARDVEQRIESNLKRLASMMSQS